MQCKQVLQTEQYNNLEVMNVGLVESIGATWSVASDTTEDYILSLAYLGNGIALAGTISSGQILRSTDYGTTWSVASDTTESDILSLSYLGNGIALAGTISSGQILRSTDYYNKN